MPPSPTPVALPENLHCQSGHCRMGLAVVLSEDEATCIITGAPRDIGGFQYYRNIYTVYTLNAGGHSYANIIISILPPPALFDLDGPVRAGRSASTMKF